MALELFEPSFDFTVRNEQRPMMIVMVSDHCGYCAQLKPVVDVVSQQFGKEVATWLVNVDRAPQLAALFAPEGVPVLVGFYQGRPTYRNVGAPSQEMLAGMYQDLVKNPKGEAAPTPPA